MIAVDRQPGRHHGPRAVAFDRERLTATELHPGWSRSRVVRGHTDTVHGHQMPSPRASRYRLLVAGRVSTTLTDVMADRFGPTTVVRADTLGTVLEIDADQSALRALLTLLWDVGHDVESMSRRDEPVQPAGE